MDNLSYIGNADPSAIEYLYKKYKEKPENVDLGWQKFFEGFDFAKTNYDDNEEVPENYIKEFRVINLIQGYRTRGHLFTKTNPVRERRKYSPTLDLNNFGLQESDLDSVFQAGGEIGLGPITLKKIILHLETTYCQSIGFEFVYMRHPEVLNWFTKKIDLHQGGVFSKEKKLEIFSTLNKATQFESFLGRKFVGQKRFSIEGGESLIPALKALIEKASFLGVKDFVMGMAHRGRLNTLTNIFQKKPHDIFSEFEGKEFDSKIEDAFDGDVKYHQGFSASVTLKNKEKIEITLSPNPSHLEAVGPVVQGIARAKIDNQYHDENKVCPVIIHGDAAISGQGVVYEVVQMALLNGYKTGGSVHIVVNNQVGFTTNYLDGRSSTYCTDVAKTTLCPVFHVNGDDVEAVVTAIEFAMEYRQTFHRDVFVDLLCYRKYGHNEGDEPKFTQPKLYNAIAKHPNPREIYFKQLEKEGLITRSHAQKMANEYNLYLENEFSISKNHEKASVHNFLQKTWGEVNHASKADFDFSPETGVNKNLLKNLGNQLSSLPENKKYYRKTIKIFKDRLHAFENNCLDWGAAEMLAYASLLKDGHNIRVSGQDVERGTFSHRHAVVTTEDSEEKVVTLNNLDQNQGFFSIYNSLLSEYGVLGFEYGYSLASPKGLTIWEAQFGDFFNGAQIMIDQFISAGEDKWFAQSGLVLLLPHGYEGQGAEHSSGRMERFLQQCADLNMQIANTSTPANHFHLLRRQLKRSFRKPLVVFTPKMLLRYPEATSTLEEMETGNFMEVIDDPNANTKNINTLVFCCGKFYYEVKNKARKLKVENMAFIRIEQLYPLPKKQINSIIEKYENANKYIWTQEEPQNMGAWRYMALNLKKISLIGVTRPATAASAAGSKKLHEKRLQKLFKNLFKHAVINV